MELTIQMYKLFIPNWLAIKDDFFNHLYTMKLKGDISDGTYGFVEVNQRENHIYGFFAQESFEDLIKYDNKQPVKIDENRWIRTPFIIDTDTLDLYLQKRNYTSKTLCHGKVLSRFEEMLSEEINQTVQIHLYHSGVSKEDFKNIFYSDENIVKEITVTNLSGSYIVEGTDLHNPREEFDKIRAESHNVYDAKILKYAHLEANDNENLSKSPTARAFIEGMGSIGEMIKYVSSSSKELITEHEKGDGKIKLKVSANINEVDEYYEVMNKGILRNINIIKTFVTLENSNDMMGISKKYGLSSERKDELYDDFEEGED